MVIEAVPELAAHMPEEKAESLAHQIASRFCKSHSGKTYRIPSLCRAEKIARDEVIREQAKTMRIKDIAKEHELSYKHVWEIVRISELS